MRVRCWSTYLSASLVAAAILLGALTARVAPADAASSSSPYVVTRSGNTYTARSATGTVFTGSLKSIVQTAAATLSSGGGGGGGTPQGGTFVPADDPYVAADTPSTNYGARATLRFDGSTTAVSLGSSESPTPPQLVIAVAP